jgi:hypothetical protein
VVRELADLAEQDSAASRSVPVRAVPLPRAM